MKLSYVDLIEVRDALVKLAEERKLPVAVEVARNLRIIQNHLKELQEDIKVLQGQYAEKDEKGNVVARNEDGSGIKFSTLEDEREYRTKVVKLHDDIVEVKFVTFDVEKLKKAEVSALVLAPLLGRVVTGVPMDEPEPIKDDGEPDKSDSE